MSYDLLEMSKSGLLEPVNGEILVDGISIYKSKKNLSRWRSSISHVPQSVYLANSSILENIAFGIPRNEIDFTLIDEVVRLSKIDEFVADLPSKLDTYVGERGIQLSGGQIQRIGIARALYKGSKIMFFDEATSALDNTTESEIIESINNLSREITIFIIAHRYSSIKGCDKTINLEDGKIKDARIF